MNYSGANYLDALGAAALSQRISNFWHSRGHDHVRTWAEPMFLANDPSHGKSCVIYQVRSNLINGSPPPRMDWGKSDGRTYDEDAQRASQ